MTTHLFGIRHHGPGCARALREALEQLVPDIVLVEGPPDAHSVLPLLTNPAMKPPVALLIYAPDAPAHAVYYPFTTFSPEWQALSYALGRNIPARFIDLPQTVRLAQEIAAAPARTGTPDVSEVAGAKSGPEGLPAADAIAEALPEAVAAEAENPAVRDDPLAMLAEAAGYTDHELWWERQVEQRQDANDLFEGILEAMMALRADLTPKDEEEALREAHMRQGIRAAEAEGFKRIAVVCGAWHTPALAQREQVKADTALLSKLPRAKVEATWIPWTNSRLSWRSGYGAGVGSPGWYEHLWTATDRIGVRWLAHAAQLLRGEGLDVSSANVIEAVRLAEALAALRDLPMPGLDEMHEATLTVLCNGDEAPMTLIREKLEIGERMGEVPPETPAVPLQRDLEARQRRLRMRQSADFKDYDLDLRNENERERSKLLHALRLLNIPWGEPQQQQAWNKLGTFHEYWRVQWQPEFAVAIIEANVWGNTVESAATAAVRATAAKTEYLAEVTSLLDRAILADLPDAVDDLLAHIAARAAVSADVRRLMDALPPLARVARYGDVRGTRADRVLPVIENLSARIVVGLPTACASLDDDAANEMVASIERAQEAMDTLQRDDLRQAWQGALRAVMERGGVHGLVRGRCCRLLLERRALDGEELRRLAGLTLSPVTPAPEAAAWVTGVLRGGAQMMMVQDGLWQALDSWLAALDGEVFVALLPLLRRAFADFEAPARRAMGEKVKHLHAAAAAEGSPETSEAVDEERARRVLPVLAQVLGVSYDNTDN
ncbi:MAG TPA: DUF5682 family protein [Ktedonobacterales bacterium]